MPMVEFEFIVEGPPYTANNDESKPKTDWKQSVGKAAYDQWITDGRSADDLPTPEGMEIHVTTYCRNTLYDVDNVLKWTLDGLKAENDPARYKHMNGKQKVLSLTYKPICVDDNQIYRVISERIELNNINKATLPALLDRAVEKFDEFLHIVIRWEESE